MSSLQAPVPNALAAAASSVAYSVTSIPEISFVSPTIVLLTGVVPNVDSRLEYILRHIPLIAQTSDSGKRFFFVLI